jgi:hypothetical protein
VQEAQKGQAITVEMRGDYPWAGEFQKAIFAKDFRSGAPRNMFEQFQTAYTQLKELGTFYQGGGLPQSCRWTTAVLPREGIDVSVS